MHMLPQNFVVAVQLSQEKRIPSVAPPGSQFVMLRYVGDRIKGYDTMTHDITLARPHIHALGHAMQNFLRVPPIVTVRANIVIYLAQPL